MEVFMSILPALPIAVNLKCVLIEAEAYLSRFSEFLAREQYRLTHNDASYKDTYAPKFLGIKARTKNPEERNNANPNR
jgi:hypothetical protein